MSTWVRLIANNEDGDVTWNDVQILIDRYVEYGKPSPSKAQEAHDTLNQVWRQYFEEAGKVQKLTPDVCCDILKKQGKEITNKIQHDFFSLIFDAVDANKDNKLQEEEFIVFHKILGLHDKALATETFHGVDSDKDGVLNREEFLAATEEFFVGNDEQSPARFIFGPLI